MLYTYLGRCVCIYISCFIVVRSLIYKSLFFFISILNASLVMWQRTEHYNCKYVSLLWDVSFMSSYKLQQNWLQWKLVITSKVQNFLFCDNLYIQSLCSYQEQQLWVILVIWGYLLGHKTRIMTVSVEFSWVWRNWVC